MPGLKNRYAGRNGSLLNRKAWLNQNQACIRQCAKTRRCLFINVLFTILPHKLFRRDAGVVAAEAERVVDDGVHLHFARGVGHVIQITFGIGRLVIDGRRDDAVFDGQRADGHFHRARRAEHVAGRALGGTDGDFFARVRRRQS